MCFFCGEWREKGEPAAGCSASLRASPAVTTFSPGRVVAITTTRRVRPGISWPMVGFAVIPVDLIESVVQWFGFVAQ